MQSQARIPGWQAARAWLRFPRVLWVAVFAALLVTLPSVGSGLLLDDHVHAAYIQNHLRSGGSRWWDLFDICCRQGSLSVAQRIEAGLLPWWTHPQLSMALLRPLSVATQYLDYVLWPNTPALMHLHNMAWYALLVVLVGMLYRRIMSGSGVAALALLLYAVDEAHAEGTAWIASRNTLMTACFAVAALIAHDGARRDGWKPGLWLAALALLLGHASGEGAIAAWAFLLPHALWIDRGPVRERVLSLAPLVLVTLGWQLVYRQLGYGVHGSGVYRDPFDAPWFFVTHRIPEVLPVVLGEQLTLSTTAASRFAFLLQPAALWTALAVCLLSVPVWLHMLVRQPEVAYWSAALLGSALPVCAIGMSPRLLFMTGVGAFALVALLVRELWNRARGLTTLLGKAQRALSLLLMAAWLLVHAVLAPLLAPHAHETILSSETLFVQSAARLPSYDRTRVDTLYVLNTPNYFVTSLSPVYASRQAPWPAHLYVLGATAAAFRITRPDARSVVLTPIGGYLLEPLSQLVRAPEVHFGRGQVIPMGALTVHVDELTSDGRPATVRFDGPKLAEPSNLWVAWYAERYHRIELPQVGASLEVPGF
jgi:hypothetical protein